MIGLCVALWLLAAFFFFFFFFFMFCPVHCLIVVFNGSCLHVALLSPCWGRDSWFLYFSVVCGLCTVRLGLFALPLGVTGRLCSVLAQC